MMLSALAVAASLLTMPVTIDLRAPTLPKVLADVAREETARIWRAAGVEIEWCANGLVHAVVDEAAGPAKDNVRVIGYVTFVDDVPAREIHLSFENALALLTETEGAANTASLTLYERYTMLGRALGRALAHELGHFLLGSKQHTATGLMRAHRRAVDFFKRGTDGFEIGADQRAALALRLPHGFASR